MDAKSIKNLAFSGILLALAFSSVTTTLRVLQRSKRLIVVKKELETLEQKKAQLEKEAQYRQTPEFIEEEARNKLSMVKPGEEVYLKPKISGDDLLGAGSQRFPAHTTEKKPPFYMGLIDKIKEILLLFQS